MNLLQIVPNKGWGGGEKCVLELSTALRKGGHNTFVVIPSSPISKEKFKTLDPLVLNTSHAFDITAIVRIAWMIRSKNIDIVHTHLFKHAMVVLLARQWFGLKVKVVMTRHLCRKAKTKLHYRWLYKHIDRLVFVSHLAKNVFLSGAPYIKEEKIEVIHNSIAIQSDTPFTDKQTDCAQAYVTIGFAGKIVAEKGVSQLITAIAECHKQTNVPFRLLIAGDGQQQYRAILQQKICEYALSDKVEFVGFVDNVLDFYKQVDIVALPSLVAEACSLSVLEAMSMGRAIVSSNGSQGEQLVSGRDAILVDPTDTNLLAKAITTLINDPIYRKKLGDAALARYRNDFLFDKYIDKYIRIYESVL